MNLYNTLTKNVDDVIPISDEVKLYTCGPTVYDHAHIGNLSSYIFADTLWRALKLDYEVNHVMNYTDVDDKTIKRSRETYSNDPPNIALQKLTDKYIEIFLNDMNLVGNDTEHIKFMKATENIEEMKTLITKLHKEGFAYISDDGVYFSIEAYKNSGKTYGQLLKLDDKNTSQARIANDEYDKDSVHDFALWKVQKDDEPAWEFELGDQNIKGRPGWHIECSAMSAGAFGLPFDIHTGGVDLIFPHHENEIAQSTASQESQKMASIFVHNEHILIDGKKMSKSANNFYTLQDIINKGYDPLAFRLLVLQSHYRNQAHFSWKNLQAAQNRLSRFRQFSDLKWQFKKGEDSKIPSLNIDVIKNAILDDINTPIAISAFDGYVVKMLDNLVFESSQKEYNEILKLADDIFGFNLSKNEDINNEQKGIIQNRENARVEENWDKSDELRDQLKQQGIGLRDSEHGTIWYRL